MPAPNRNASVDLIRTAALLGICVVNVPFMALPIEDAFLPPEHTMDQVALFIIETCFQMKFFLLFSFLFGLGMHIQDLSAARAGVSFAGRYARRLIVLAGLGAAHAVLVFTGDILLIYAVIGLLIWPFRHLSARSLIRLALAMIPIAMLMLVALAVILSEPISIHPSDLGGSYVEATAARLRDWMPSFALLMMFQGPLVFGAFASGLAAAKAGFLERDSAGRQWLQRRVPWLLGFGLLFNLLFAATLSGFLPSEDVLGLMGLVAIALGAPMLSAVYLYVLLWVSVRITLPQTLLQAGRNSLSAYVLQGIIAGALFGGYGFGLFDQIGQAGLIPISVAIAILAMLIVGWSAKLFGRGPLEALLRKVTYWH